MKQLPYTLEELTDELRANGMTESGLCEVLGNDLDYIGFPSFYTYDGFYLIHLTHGLAILPYRMLSHEECFQEDAFTYVGEEEVDILERAEEKVKLMQEALDFAKEKTRLFRVFQEGDVGDEHGQMDA